MVKVHEKVLKDLLPERLYKPLERVGEKLPWGDDYPLEEMLEPYCMAHVYACQRVSPFVFHITTGCVEDAKQ